MAWSMPSWLGGGFIPQRLPAPHTRCTRLLVHNLWLIPSRNWAACGLGPVSAPGIAHCLGAVALGSSRPLQAGPGWLRLPTEHPARTPPGLGPMGPRRHGPICKISPDDQLLSGSQRGACSHLLWAEGWPRPWSAGGRTHMGTARLPSSVSDSIQIVCRKTER